MPRTIGRDYSDHCHTTGKLRGILCSSCNIALGNIRDNTDTLARMLEYVR